jgi:hypothetical protein
MGDEDGKAIGDELPAKYMSDREPAQKQCKKNSPKGVECLADDEGHERGVFPGDEGEPKLDGWSESRLRRLRRSGRRRNWV